jgi:phosphoglycerol geranylgeranyltransferase
MTQRIQTLIATAPTQLAVLIDPGKQSLHQLKLLIHQLQTAHVDMILVGGSLLMADVFHQTIALLKSETNIPVVIFPGSNYQVSPHADALLLLSLVSGRNADYLIGQHIAAAPLLHQSGIEIIPTAYMLIDGGRISTTAYITQTMPIPRDKTDIAIATALAAQMLGMRTVYLEAGSGALEPVPVEMIQAVKSTIDIPIIVGGGIRTPRQAADAAQAGAAMLVVGTALERNPELLLELSLAVHQ